MNLISIIPEERPDIPYGPQSRCHGALRGPGPLGTTSIAELCTYRLPTIDFPSYVLYFIRYTAKKQVPVG